MLNFVPSLASTSSSLLHAFKRFLLRAPAALFSPIQNATNSAPSAAFAVAFAFAFAFRSRIEWHNINPKVVEPRLAGVQNAFLIMHMEGRQNKKAEEEELPASFVCRRVRLWSCQANFLTSLKSVSGSRPPAPSYNPYPLSTIPYSSGFSRLDEICLSGSFAACFATLVVITP